MTLGSVFESSSHSLVVAAVGRADTEVVVKVQVPHRESEHEAAALAHFDGDGAVRLLDSADDGHSLLLERCRPGRPLAAADPEAALGVFVDLLPRLWRPAGAPFRSVEDEVAHWAVSLPHSWEGAGRPCPRRLVEAALDELAGLAASQGERVLVHQDLHAGNVLSARRRPWLVIDPKPLLAERAFAVAPIVRGAELGAERRDVLRRLDRLADELALDRRRCLGWTLGQSMAWGFDGRRALGHHLQVATWLEALV